ncbi:Hsp20/alpha crystallin family protein [Pseudoxanthomonas sp. SGD-10]|nr:Hsp20/alpha crystallin family protein [Pseudoxanthomonas sp. SGD-10]
MALVKFNGKASLPVYTPFSGLFDSFFKDDLFQEGTLTKVPAVNISEDENKYSIEVATPGLKKEDFKLNIEDNVLTVSAEKKSEIIEDNKKVTRREFNYSSFSRSFTLPELADASKISAKYTDGVLQVDIAKKAEAKALSREIAIS